MVSRRSSSKPLRRRLPSLLHPVFRRAPVEGTVGLRNPASCDPVRERGDQVFGERTRAATGIEFFPNDDFFPGIGSLFINDMGDNINATASTAVTLYNFLIFLLEIFLEFLLIIVSLDLFGLSTVLVDRMISLILLILVIICLRFCGLNHLKNCLYIQQSKNLIIGNLQRLVFSRRRGRFLSKGSNTNGCA